MATLTKVSKLLTVHQVAQLKRVSAKAVYRWIRLGKLRSHQEWGRVFVNRDDAERFKMPKNGRPKKKR